MVESLKSMRFPTFDPQNTDSEEKESESTKFGEVIHHKRHSEQLNVINRIHTRVETPNKIAIRDIRRKH